MAFIIDEHFTTGSAPSGWSGSGGNYAYATSPAPLEGIYSLLVSANNYVAYTNASEVTGEQWGAFLYNIPALPTPFTTVLTLFSGAFNITLKLLLGSDGTFIVTGGGAFQATVGSVTTGVTAYCFWRYKPGSGSNGEYEFWFNSSNDRAGTPSNNHVLVTNSTVTEGIQYLLTDTTTGDQAVIYDVVGWANTDEFAGGGSGSSWYVFAQQM